VTAGPRPAADTVRLKRWILLTGAGTLVLLVVLLWSAQRRRQVHLTFGAIDTLAEALPSIAGATHGALLAGNEIEVLQNGDGFFPALLAAIAGARETVHLESYVWWRGRICEEIAEALARKAEAGVEVRVLLDAAGSARMERRLLDRMLKAGCKVARFGPLRVSNLARVNYRDHRKIAVVDGRVGFTFGHGIADEWLGDGEDREHWRDTGARIEGPVVGALQSAFTENWVEETGEVLVGARFFPPLPPAGTMRAHVAYHSQRGSVAAVDLLFRLAFVSARRELWIQNPYIAPEHDIVDLVVQAAERGVDVRIMVPGEITDSQIVRHAGHRHFDRLLASGVRIFEYQKTLIHQKVVIVDGLWSHLGSTNLDIRSLESSDEISLGVVDEGVAAELRSAFLDDARHAREITLEAWRAESRLHRLRDALSWRFAGLL
jgi:cardiolipin synthase